ncbi:MAG: aminomethyltransferase family protein [Desulfotalea sp.]
MSSKTTTLHSFHLAQDANMALFGGYDMPLWYGVGAKAEHLSVIERAGIFDTSHMATVTVVGAGAKKLLQHCFSKDLDKCTGLKKTELVIGRCAYGLFLREDGCVIDDGIVYMLGENRYMVIVNAGMGEIIATHLQGFAEGDVKIKDVTETVGKMDLQGPFSAVILQKVIKNPEAFFDFLPYFSFKGGTSDCPCETEVQLLDGTSFMVSRTGYTGEFGFEFFIDREKLIHLWNIILEAGEEYGLGICGLAARDSLRAGAVLPLSHQDIGNWVFSNTPWPFALPFSEDGFSKDFIGADVVGERCEDDFTYAFAGFDPRKIKVDADTAVELKDKVIGEVLTCTTDMAIGRINGHIFSVVSSLPENQEGFVAKGLSCGFVRVGQELTVGSKVFLTNGKRKIEVEIRDDIRPDRTARRAVAKMLELKK